MGWNRPHSTTFSGGVRHRSSKASRGEDLDIEEPVRGGYSPAFHFHPTLTGMHGTTLIGDQVVQVREPRQKHLLTAAWMVKRFHPQFQGDREEQRPATTKSDGMWKLAMYLALLQSTCADIVLK
jgi:hypothetical protein